MCDRPFWQTRKQNIEGVARVIQRLDDLKAIIDEMPPASRFAQDPREELVRYVSPSEIGSNTLNLGCTFRKLDVVSDQLKGLPVKSILSADVERCILACIKQIDEHEQDFIVSRLLLQI
jgi:hypothetical protein